MTLEAWGALVLRPKIGILRHASNTARADKVRNVDHSNLIQSFVEQRERGEPIGALHAALERSMEHVGIPNFACCSHVDPANPPRGAIMHHNYPASWVKAFSESRLYETDPVLKYAEKKDTAFFWHDARFRAQLTATDRVILAAASTLGIRHGFTLPLRDVDESASCSFVLDSIAVDERSCSTAMMLGAYFYEVARAVAPGVKLDCPIILSRRELACLEFAAQGLSDWECSQMLKISESTVQRHIRRAMLRLGTPTRAQAIAKVLVLRLIRFGDVLRPHASDPIVIYEAAEWFVRLSEGKISRATRRRYVRWLAESSAHAEAMGALWKLEDQLEARQDLLSLGMWRLH